MRIDPGPALHIATRGRVHVRISERLFSSKMSSIIPNQPENNQTGIQHFYTYFRGIITPHDARTKTTRTERIRL